ncbi:MAG: hypothetical protein RR484_00690, partial [Anaerorhabdus sp.]
GTDETKNVIVLTYNKNMQDISFTIYDRVGGVDETTATYKGTANVWELDSQVVPVDYQDITKSQSVHDGYSLTGYEDENGNEVDLSTLSTLPAGTKLYAVYDANKYDVTIQYQNEEGSTINATKTIKDAQYNTTVNAIDHIIEINGYTFKSSNPESVTVSSDVQKNNIILTYQKNMKNISFEIYDRVGGVDETTATYKGTANVWELDSQVVPVDYQDITKSQSVHDGYSLTGYEDENGNKVELSTMATLPAGTKLYAVYKEALQDYTVIYYSIDEAKEIDKTSGQEYYKKEIKYDAFNKNMNGYVFAYANPEKLTITTDAAKNVMELYYYVDVVGGRDSNGNDTSDNIPDCFQVKFTYNVQTVGTGYVTDSNLTSEYEYVTRLDENGEYSLTAKVKPIGKDIVAKSAANYKFVKWVDGQNNSYNTINDIRNNEYQDSVVFTAIFERVVVPPTPTEPPVLPTPEVIVPPVKPIPANPQPEIIQEEDTPKIAPTATPNVEEIIDEETPEIGKSSWALINLIAMIVGLLLTIVLLASKHDSDEEEEDNGVVNQDEEMPELYERKRIYKVLGTIISLVSVVVFVLTENVLLPMVLVDKYTLIMLVFALMNAVTLYLGRKWHDVNEEEEVHTQS